MKDRRKPWQKECQTLPFARCGSISRESAKAWYDLDRRGASLDALRRCVKELPWLEKKSYERIMKKEARSMTANERAEMLRVFAWARAYGKTVEDYFKTFGVPS